MSGKFWGLFPFGSRELSCGKLRQISSDFLDGTLSPKHLWKFNYHTERCRGCGAFVSTLRATTQTLNTLPSLNAPEDMKQRLMDQFPGESNKTDAGS